MGRQAQIMAKLSSMRVQRVEAMSTGKSKSVLEASDASSDDLQVVSGLVVEKSSVVIRSTLVMVTKRPKANTIINALFWLVGSLDFHSTC